MKQLSLLFSVMLIITVACKTKKAAINEEIKITYAADTDYTSDISTGDDVFEAVEVMPKYPGGEEARTKFIKKNLVYPNAAIKQKKEGLILVKFVVEADSSVSNVKLFKSFDEECGKEVIRVTKMMRWIPGEQKGKAVRVWVVMPVKLKLP